jgi:hypothetical protein
VRKALYNLITELTFNNISCFSAVAVMSFPNKILSSFKLLKLLSITLLLVAFVVPSHGEETFGKMYRSRVIQLTSMLKMHYPILNMTILDVGANTGAWSVMMKSYFSNVSMTPTIYLPTYNCCTHRYLL